MKKSKKIEIREDLYSSFLDGVLDDYHNCKDISSCSNCKANMSVFKASMELNKESYTFCEFLRKHRLYAENKIIDALDNSL